MEVQICRFFINKERISIQKEQAGTQCKYAYNRKMPTDELLKIDRQSGIN